MISQSPRDPSELQSLSPRFTDLGTNPGQLDRLILRSAKSAISRNRKNCNVCRSRSFMPSIVSLRRARHGLSVIVCIPEALRATRNRVPVVFFIMPRTCFAPRLPYYRIFRFRSPFLCKLPPKRTSLPSQRLDIDEARHPFLSCRNIGVRAGGIHVSSITIVKDKLAVGGRLVEILGNTTCNTRRTLWSCDEVQGSCNGDCFWRFWVGSAESAWNE